MDLVAHSEQHTSKLINIQIPCSRPADDWDCFQKAGYVDATKSLKTSHVVCDGGVFRKDQLGFSSFHSHVALAISAAKFAARMQHLAS